MVTGCRCHDPVVFGHQSPCVLGPPSPARKVRDYRTELTDQQLARALELAREYNRGITATMPRSKYAVTGGWLKKRG